MRSSGDNVAHRAGREAGPHREHERDGEPGSDGKANTCELLINVVRSNEHNRADALGQKARAPVDRLINPISQTSRSPADRQSLPHLVTPIKQGKPVYLPWKAMFSCGKACRKAAPMDMRVEEIRGSECPVVMIGIAVRCRDAKAC